MKEKRQTRLTEGISEETELMKETEEILPNTEQKTRRWNVYEIFFFMIESHGGKILTLQYLSNKSYKEKEEGGEGGNKKKVE